MGNLGPHGHEEFCSGGIEKSQYLLQNINIPFSLQNHLKSRFYNVANLQCLVYMIHYLGKLLLGVTKGERVVSDFTVSNWCVPSSNVTFPLNQYDFKAFPLYSN